VLFVQKYTQEQVNRIAQVHDAVLFLASTSLVSSKLQRALQKFVANSKANLSAQQFVTNIRLRVLLWLSLTLRSRFAKQ
jgi:hypothetical protein